MGANIKKIIMVFSVVVLVSLFMVWMYETIQGTHQTNKVVKQAPVIKQADVQVLVAAGSEERETERNQVAATPPEIERLEQLVTDFECVGRADPTQGWNTLIAIGDIYKKGAYPRFVPDDELAMEIYKEAAKCPHGEVAGMAQSRYIETHNNPVSLADRSGDPFPSDYGKRACAEANRRMQIIGMQGFMGGLEKPRLARRIGGDTQVSVPDVAEYEEVAMLATALLDGGNMGQARQHIASPVVDDRSDSQNVHDHGVVAALRTTLQSMPQVEETKELSAIESARATVLRMRDEERISEQSASDALLVIDSLNASKNGSMGSISERQALARVWQKITESTNSDNLQEILTKQLASGVEHGNVVCSTGKITRMAATFEGMTDDNNVTNVARPMWAVREELMQLAAKVRDEYLAHLSVGDRAVYESGGTIDSSHEEAMTRIFRKQVQDEYVLGLGMNADILDPVVTEIAAGF